MVDLGTDLLGIFIAPKSDDLVIYLSERDTSQLTKRDIIVFLSQCRVQKKQVILMSKFWKFNLRPGEVLKCDHCTHEVHGNDLNVVYFEEATNSDSDFMVRCQTCHDILQDLGDTEA